MLFDTNVERIFNYREAQKLAIPNLANIEMFIGTGSNTRMVDVVMFHLFGSWA